MCVSSANFSKFLSNDLAGSLTVQLVLRCTPRPVCFIFDVGFERGRGGVHRGGGCRRACGVWGAWVHGAVALECDFL